MKSILTLIFAAMLCLPVHALSYVQTVLHLAQTEPDEAAESDHDHDEGHDHDEHHDHDLAHRHAPDEPVHSHDRDIWGLFSHSVLRQENVIVYGRSPSLAFDLPFSYPDDFVSEPFSGSLLRPPIG